MSRRALRGSARACIPADSSPACRAMMSASNPASNGDPYHDRHDDQSRPHDLPARAVAGHAVAQGPCVRRRAQPPGGRGRDQGRHRRHGLSVLVPAGAEDDHRALEETIIPHVIGKDATAVEGIWNEIWKRTVTYNRGGIVTMAMSALDIALWDAIGKRANMPLHRLWGHVRVAASGVRLGLFPRLGRRRHDREGAVLQGARLQGDQDADGAHHRSAPRRRQREAHARGGRPRHGTS